MDSSYQPIIPVTVVRCSICDKSFDPEESPAMPFCSERCRLIDLRGWLDEEYGLPYEGEDDVPNGETGDEETPGS